MNIRDYANGHTSDWGPLIQQAIDDLRDPKEMWPNQSGGIIHYPRGMYPVKTPIILRCPNVGFSGEGGGFAAYTTWLRGMTDDEPMCRLLGLGGSDNSSGFHARDIKFTGGPKGAKIDAFDFAESDRYTRGFTFDDCTMSYFRKVFTAAPNTKTWGGLLIRNCSLIYNGQVLDAANQPGGFVNEVEFSGKCWIEKNGLASEGWKAAYAIDLVGADNVAILGAVLEGQPRAIRIRQSQGITVERCRFEGNCVFGDESDDPVCLFEQCRHVRFQAYNRVLGRENKPDVPPIVAIHDCEDATVQPVGGRVQIWRSWVPVY